MERFRRSVGLVVLGAAVVGAGFVGWLGARASLLVALATALACAALVVVIEERITTWARRTAVTANSPLAPKLVMARTRGVYAGPVTITAIIPAHNEEARIRATLAALNTQSRPPERIIVVADRCSDYTVSIAHAWGVDVMKTIDNKHGRAGALNQALAQVLPDLGDNDAVLVMDADTVLDAGFVEEAARRLTDDRALMVVDGHFYGSPGAGLLGLFQRNEYLRHSRTVRRRSGAVSLLPGTASVFRPLALRTVAAARGNALPGRSGDVFSPGVLTEDDELTVALRSLGALTAAPAKCEVVTEVVPTWPALWAQRLRWQRGALENLATYGVGPHTLRFWVQQLGLGYGVVAIASYVVLVSTVAVSLDRWVWLPFWIGAAAVFAAERVISVWRAGWEARGVAVLLLPELGYALFLCAVYVKGAVDLALERRSTWRRVVPDSGGVGALR